MQAGQLDQRFRFEKRATVDDGHGNQVAGEFVAQFTVWTNRKYLRGGEGVLASRLEARQPVILTVRRSTDTRQIEPEWRAVDDRAGVVYAIREIPRVTDDRGFLEMLAEAGVAA